MYLARESSATRWHYFLRQSYEADGLYRNRTLCALGCDPREHIRYPGGNAFYIDEKLVARAEAAAGEPLDSEALEEVFWPFVKPAIRRAIDGFRHRGTQRPRPFPLNAQAQEALGARIHPFDKRRLLLLRLGRLAPGDERRTPASLLRRLDGKSRDELEQMLAAMESLLPERELKGYVYLIFDLQSRFSERYAAHMPAWLEPERVDGAFLESYCALHSDARFRQGVESEQALWSGLTRYVVMYFDNAFAAPNPGLEYMRDFMRRHRDYRPPPAQPLRLEAAELVALFATPLSQLKRMSRRELARCFRRRAQVLHPDCGGDHHSFCRLAAAYRQLLKQGRSPA